MALTRDSTPIFKIWLSFPFTFLQELGWDQAPSWGIGRKKIVERRAVPAFFFALFPTKEGGPRLAGMGLPSETKIEIDRRFKIMAKLPEPFCVLGQNSGERLGSNYNQPQFQK